MTIHVDYPPVPECKHPELTYGMICVKCGECGRFEYGGASNPVKSEIQVIEQFNMGYLPLWQYPERHGFFYNGEWRAWRHSSKNTFKAKGNLEDILPPSWLPDQGLGHVRWWIEGRNY